MRGINKALLLLAASMISSAGFAQADAAAPQQSATQASSALEQVVDKVAAREAAYVTTMRQYTPLVETYLQEMVPDPVMGEVPKNDWYHLSRLSLANKTVDVLNFAGKDDMSAEPQEHKNILTRTASATGRTLTFGKLGGGARYGYMSAGFDS